MIIPNISPPKKSVYKICIRMGSGVYILYIGHPAIILFYN